MNRSFETKKCMLLHTFVDISSNLLGYFIQIGIFLKDESISFSTSNGISFFIFCCSQFGAKKLLLCEGGRGEVIRTTSQRKA